MSQQELEKTDQEVMDLVNKAASPEATQNAERIAEECISKENAPVEDQTENADETDKLVRKFLRRRRGHAVAGIVLCVLIAAVLLVTMAVPELLIWVVNIGVLSCGITCSILVDRMWRRWRV